MRNGLEVAGKTDQRLMAGTYGASDGGVVVAGRQRDQERLFAFAAVDRPLAGSAVFAHVGDVIQPAVHVTIRIRPSEHASWQKADAQVVNPIFDFAFFIAA